MTNLEIVEKEVVERGFLTEEECGIIIGKYGELPYKTYQEWKYSGYQVKRGSKAIIKTKLWKKVSEKKDEESEVYCPCCNAENLFKYLTNQWRFGEYDD